jgi:hypothetical protein
MYRCKRYQRSVDNLVAPSGAQPAVLDVAFPLVDDGVDQSDEMDVLLVPYLRGRREVGDTVADRRTSGQTVLQHPQDPFLLRPRQNH